VYCSPERMEKCFGSCLEIARLAVSGLLGITLAA
jgi:hypothetical protein